MASVNSKKHRSDQELTKDDFVAQGDEDDTDALAHHAQPFARASAEVLATRRIVRAHRVIATDVSTGPQNPFAQVSLVAAAPPKEELNDSASTKEKDGTEGTKETADDSKEETATKTEPSTIVDENDKTKNDTTTTESASKETEEAPKPFVFGSAAPFSGFGAVLPGNGFGSSTTAGFGSSTATGFGGSAASGFGEGFSSFSALGGKSGSGFSFAKKVRTEDTEGDDATNENDDTNVPPVAILPEHYELKSGEEGYECLLELRCRTWKLSSASSKDASTAKDGDQKGNPSVPTSFSFVPPSKTSLNEAAAEESSTKVGVEEETKKWSEVGIGPLRILRRPSETSNITVTAPPSFRIVQRRESSKGGSATNLILNLRPAAITMQATASEVHVQLVTVTGIEKAETHLFKFKLASEAQQFKDCLSSIAAEVEASAASGEEPIS
jgi:NUP50 (Nucleoporin 50 kDa)